MISLIAAIDPNNVIGKAGSTPWHIPDELKLFKEITYGHALIAGHTTYKSIGHGLPGRTLYVLSHTALEHNQDGVVFCSSLEDALEKTKKERTVFVIGGGSVYDEFMPLAQEMRISHLRTEYSGDVYFPEIDHTIWRIHTKTEYPLFTHIHYVRNEQPSKNR